MIDYSAEKYINIILSAMGKIEEEYYQYCEQMKDLDNETQDWLHKLELMQKPKLYDLYYIAKRLRQIRIERRAVKNQKYALWPIKDFLDRTQTFKSGIIKAQGEVKRNVKGHEGQVYKPRVISEEEYGK